MASKSEMMAWQDLLDFLNELQVQQSMRSQPGTSPTAPVPAGDTRSMGAAAANELAQGTADAIGGVIEGAQGGMPAGEVMQQAQQNVTPEGKADAALDAVTDPQRPGVALGEQEVESLGALLEQAFRARQAKKKGKKKTKKAGNPHPPKGNPTQGQY